jgi:hypothetical protein
MTRGLDPPLVRQPSLTAIEKLARRVEMFSEHLNGSAAVPADGFGVPPRPRPFFEDAGSFAPSTMRRRARACSRPSTPPEKALVTGLAAIWTYAQQAQQIFLQESLPVGAMNVMVAALGA